MSHVVPYEWKKKNLTKKFNYLMTDRINDT